MLADAQLAPFFEHTPVDRLRTMQREFFSAALEGPVVYTGRPLYDVHAGHDIRREDFARFADHLFATLRTFALSERDTAEIVARINTYADEVIGSQGPAS